MTNKKQILKNIGALTLSEFFNKGIIFFTTTYLIRTIFPEGNGVLSYANAYYCYFAMFAHLALSTVGTREIAKDYGKTKDYADTITTWRLLLSIIVFVVYLFIILNSDKSFELKLVTLLTGMNLFANAVNMDWVFQGLEKMQVLAFRQMLTGSLTFVGYLVFVHSRADVYLAVIISSSSLLLNVLWLFFYYTKKYYKFNFRLNIPLIKKILKSAIPLTFYVMSVSVLNQANILILEYLYSDTVLIGIYNAAFKIVVFGYIPSSIIQMAFFPILSRTENIEDRRNIYRKFSVLNLFFGCLIAIALFVFPELIVGIIFGAKYADSAPILRILSFIVIPVFLSTATTPTLIAWTQEKKVVYSIAIGSILSLIANLVMIPMFQIQGAAYSAIIGEATITVSLLVSMYLVIRIALFKEIFVFLAITAATIAGSLILLDFGVNQFLVAGLIIIFYFALSLITKMIKIADIKGLIKR